jgi:hypothetical protein
MKKNSKKSVLHPFTVPNQDLHPSFIFSNVSKEYKLLMHSQSCISEALDLQESKTCMYQGHAEQSFSFLSAFLKIRIISLTRILGWLFETLSLDVDFKKITQGNNTVTPSNCHGWGK